MKASQIDDARLMRLAKWFHDPVVEPEEIQALAQAEVDRRKRAQKEQE